MLPRRECPSTQGPKLSTYLPDSSPQFRVGGVGLLRSNPSLVAGTTENLHCSRPVVEGVHVEVVRELRQAELTL
jgi:hypothetical protein